MTSEREPVVAEDVNVIHDPSMIHLSPDARQAVFAVSTLDEKGEKMLSHLWHLDLPEGEVRQFTFAQERAMMPRWSPDGRWIAFISNRDNEKEMHLYVMSAHGGEAQQITHSPILAVTDFDWSPDGEWLVFTAKAKSPEEMEQEKAGKKQEILWREVTRLVWKMDGEGWWDGHWTQVWKVRRDGADAKQLTQAEVDHAFPRWSPDGQWIAFVSKRVDDPDRAFFDDLFLIPPEGGEEKKLTRSQGPIIYPAWSLDGSRLAYFGQDLERGYNSNIEVWTVALDGSAPTSLTRGLDRSVGDQLLSDGRMFPGDPGPVWLDEERIGFLCSDRGKTHFYDVTLSGQVSQLTEGAHRLYAFHTRPGADWVLFGRSSPTQPGELVRWDWATKEFNELTSFNRKFRERKTLVGPEFFQVESPGGVTVDAWLMMPPDFDPNKTYPLILYIHGGPHLAYGWSWFHEFQYLASAGYGVLYTNPRGSQSYGEAFNDAIRGNWGSPVQEDVEAAVDAVIERGFIDAKRVGVAGGSFGGYMTSWLVGHSDRYAAAVSQRAVNSMINLAGNDDVGHYFCRWEAPGCPWENWDWYINHSPLTYVQNMHTPLLIIHSDQDHRCPIDQAEQLYRALRLLDREVGFVVFVGASHGLSRNGRPKQRVERLQRILGWFQKYMPVQGGQQAQTTSA